MKITGVSGSGKNDTLSRFGRNGEATKPLVAKRRRDCF